MSRRVYVTVVTISITVVLASHVLSGGDGQQLQVASALPEGPVEVHVTTTLVEFELTDSGVTATAVSTTTVTTATTAATAATTTTLAPPPPPPPPSTTEAPTTTTTEPEPEPEPTTVVEESPPTTEAPPARVVESRNLSGGWAALIQCESGGDYTINTGNGFYGAYQFVQSTWDGAVARAGYSEYVGMRASNAPPYVQDAAAQQLYSERGSQPWPVCGQYV